ncbi:MAG TPA: peptidase U32 family protein [Bacteroidales bacterium]|nr:peptidase U32 family protein [Bacteroidales bacterium]
MNLLKNNEIDLMSPVGSSESLMAAIQAGARSVYFGVGKLNMRSRSTVNFTIDDLHNISDICRENRVNTYLTVNTVIYDEEIDEMHELLRAASRCGISAIIASDVAVMQFARQTGLEVHASTQVNISNTEAVRFFSQWCDVVVLARELNLEQVSRINQNIVSQNICGPSGKPVKTEMFVHGALCMAISGKCYLSLHEYAKSANRGACFQSCRRSYRAIDNESGYELEIDNEYIMSPKDLKTIHFLNKIIDAGVSVLKIEGRARAPEYVKTVTACYREAIDSIAAGTYNEVLIGEWNQRLSTVFNRGFWDGYYLGQKLGEWSMHYGSAATRTKTHIGRCTNYFAKSKVAEFIIETPDVLRMGNEVMVSGPTTGVVEFVVDEMRVDDGLVEKCEKGLPFSMKTPEPVRRNDKLYLYISEIKK